ncbi:MAG: hypothetical protein HFE63_02930 [Clostridiales bacterium]|nr:hypothetical protein [Clostridiales bacterium]
MPYINFKTSAQLTAEKETELKAELGRAISIIPGKSETYLMVEIQDNAHLWLGGDDSAPAAMVDVKIFGHAKPSDFSSLTAEICRISKSKLGISPSRVYVTYAEVENWGWNGSNF